MFQVGEQAVWMRIDEMTGKRVSDLVVVRDVKTFAGKPFYRIQILKTGEVAQSYPDELFRFQDPRG